MKRSIIFALLCVVSLHAFAQSTSLNEARGYLSEQDYKSAIPLLDNAVKHEETKASAEAWFLRGMAYLQMAVDNPDKPEATDNAYTSLQKTLSLNPNYGAEINSGLYNVGLLKYNKAVALYTAKSFSGAYDEFMAVSKLYNGYPTRFADNNEFKEVGLNSRKNAAYAAINAGRNSDAIPLLKDLVNNESKNEPDIYQALIETYKIEKNEAQEKATIAAARKQFPDNETFRNLELNTYISSGEQDVLLQKLEEAVAKTPNNPELQFNIGNAYTKLAFPTDVQGKAEAQPANFSTVYAKAENAYLKALQLSPDDADYNYNLGILHYSYASWYIKQSMNKEIDDKLYDELTAASKQEMRKGLPYFEHSYKVLNSKGTTLTESERATFRNSMIALKEIYSRTGEAAKKAEMEAAIERSK